MASEKLNDEQLAVDYLTNERDKAKDPKLAEMLNRRLTRLQGLITLRNAQARFEKEQGHPLTSMNELITSGTLKSIPKDPTHIGYELVKGKFQLRAIIINGVEIR